MQQAMASDSLDIALGSGPAMAFIVKGSPIKGVAAMAGPPLLLAIVVRPDGPKTAADLKGKKISVSTAGSLTYWLVSETSRRQGWGPKGIEIAPMGAMPGQIAAMKRGDIDGAIMDIGNAFELEKRGEGRILIRFTDIKDFHIHVIFAADKLIAERPEALRAFLKGWFETIDFMHKNKAETVAIAKEVTNKDDDYHLTRLRRVDADVLRRWEIQSQARSPRSPNHTSNCNCCRRSRIRRNFIPKHTSRLNDALTPSARRFYGLISLSPARRSPSAWRKAAPRVAALSRPRTAPRRCARARRRQGTPCPAWSWRRHRAGS